MTSLLRRHMLFMGTCALSLILFYQPVSSLVSLAFHDDRYTDTLAIPPLSAFLLWLNRSVIFRRVRHPPEIKFLFLFPLFALVAIRSVSARVGAEYAQPIGILILVLVIIGAFVCCYGIQAARAALFPLVFLVLIIPIPATILDHIVVVLQKRSADVSYHLFQLAGVPVVKEGAVKFSLPGVTIEVAEECSGIRSGVSLFLSSIVAGYLFLRSIWSRTFLALMTIPIVIFKNAVRIVTISCLGIYIDPAFLHGRLHRYSGLPFSLLALALLAPLLLLLMKTDRGQKPNVVGSDPVSTVG